MGVRVQEGAQQKEGKVGRQVVVGFFCFPTLSGSGLLLFMRNMIQKKKQGTGQNESLPLQVSISLTKDEHVRTSQIPYRKDHWEDSLFLHTLLCSVPWSKALWSLWIQHIVLSESKFVQWRYLEGPVLVSLVFFSAESSILVQYLCTVTIFEYVYYYLTQKCFQNIILVMGYGRKYTILIFSLNRISVLRACRGRAESAVQSLTTCPL